MLALRSYEQSNGFSVMDADELFFINGGSSTTGGNMGGASFSQGPISTPSSTGQKIAFWASWTILALTSMGNAPDNIVTSKEQAAMIAGVNPNNINESTKK